MDALDDSTVDLIVTSPPYFPAELEPSLRARRRAQTEVATVREAIVRYALTLRPVFAECVRVLRRGGVLVMQTKDIRYGGALVPLASVHRDLVESCGLFQVTRVFWQRTYAPLRHGDPDAPLERARHVSGFVAGDVEEFLVFSNNGGPRNEGLVDIGDDELRDALVPLWRLPGAPGRRRHPYASPSTVVRRFVRLYSRPGDLVIDPFAGSGTTMRVAMALGRRAMGWEIDPTWGVAPAATGDMVSSPRQPTSGHRAP
jgi:DNA modification methylase